VARDAVVALGHPWRGDDGVGLRVLELLKADSRLSRDVDLIDAAGNSLAALHSLSGRRKVLFVDCASMGEKPATCRRFLPSEVRSKKTMPHLSLHEGDLLETLEMARTLGDTAQEVVILGIEPFSVEMGAQLSPALEGRLGEYVDCVIAEFK
jgi:hydrogenase maturation protease